MYRRLGVDMVVVKVMLSVTLIAVVPLQVGLEFVLPPSGVLLGIVSRDREGVNRSVPPDPHEGL